jgi:hypothetical protein
VLMKKKISDPMTLAQSAALDVLVAPSVMINIHDIPEHKDLHRARSRLFRPIRKHRSCALMPIPSIGSRIIRPKVTDTRSASTLR